MISQISPSVLKRWMDNNEAVLIDVREPVEHGAENIPEAHLLPLSRMTMADLPLRDGKRLVLHCKRGARGSSACQKLLSEDPSLEIYNLEGGIDAWAAAGMPICTSGKVVLPLDRQVQLAIGICVLIFSFLGYLVNPLFFLGTAFFGAGLTFAGITGFCGLALIMARMPWNQAVKAS